MKKFLIILIIIFTCGVLSADVCMKQMEEQIVSERAVYEQYATAKLMFSDVFWNVLYERIKLFGILVLLCFTPLKEKTGAVFAIVFSYIWGYYLMQTIIELGFVGLAVGLASVIPHVFFYGGSMWLLLRKKHIRNYLVQEKLVMQAVSVVGIVLLFFTGCILESVMGTFFIPWVIRLGMV